MSVCVSVCVIFISGRRWINKKRKKKSRKSVEQSKNGTYIKIKLALTQLSSEVFSIGVSLIFRASYKDIGDFHFESLPKILKTYEF